VLTSCSNSSNNATKTIQTEDETSQINDETSQTKPLTLQDLKKEHFKFYNLTEFELDKFNWEERKGKYTELDRAMSYMIWQDSNCYIYFRDYLFSWQERDTNFIEFTILTEDEDSWCTTITYCIFDKKSKFIDKFTVRSRCGDGGWVFDSWGKFINKKTYEMLCVEQQLLFPSDNEELYNEKGVLYDEGEELYEGDSTLYHYIINDNGKVTQKEIFKKHFIEKD